MRNNGSNDCEMMILWSSEETRRSCVQKAELIYAIFRNCLAIKIQKKQRYILM